MKGPFDENTAPRKALVSQPPDHDHVIGEESRNRQPDRHAETRRTWVEANRDRVREMNRRWRAEHLERARQLNRDSMRRATARQRRQVELRDSGRERAKRWREAHPDRVRKYQQRWVEENREKVREYYNRYYANHRDEVNARAAARRDADPDPDRTKQAHKRWAERNKERRAEVQRIRRADPEIYQAELEANAAAKRLKRTLSRAGLPPRQLHLATAAERRTNEREADAYFRDPTLPEHVRQFTVFAESLTEHMRQNGTRTREFAESYVATRTRMGLPPVSVENIVYARAVERVTERMRRVDLLTSRDVAAAVRAAKAVVPREERQEQFDRLVKAVVTNVHRNSERFVVDAEMENRARAHRGKPRVPVESVVVQFAMQEVIERMPTERLTVDDARKVARVARLRLAMSSEPGLGAVIDRIQRRPLG
ncbi:hypothetical protein E3T24_00035 [Cryobacterium sp. TmT2-59]|uniref:hypothetical protein n=1 Tax=Cryobacterium sp. TmT2-59 TaxID=1259264 RepID=UPI001069F3A8|nr:hypothetical protein [Cryobacterium sp. TmT2-59]TFC90077.1 hypothetical protein E3T24_00035 [Cryobacterium sp. TmT2-59]